MSDNINESIVFHSVDKNNLKQKRRVDFCCSITYEVKRVKQGQGRSSAIASENSTVNVTYQGASSKSASTEKGSTARPDSSASFSTVQITSKQGISSLPGSFCVSKSVEGG